MVIPLAKGYVYYVIKNLPAIRKNNLIHSSPTTPKLIQREFRVTKKNCLPNKYEAFNINCYLCIAGVLN